MKSIKWYLALICACLYVGSTSSLYAQCKIKNEAFKAGETINYDLYFNWKFVWVKAGFARMTASASTWKGDSAYRMELLCCGNKKADAFFKMRDTLTSVISTELEPLYYRKGSFEGKTYTLDEVYFNYNNGISSLKQRRFKKGKTTDTTFSRNHCIYDMVSIMAYARSLNLSSMKNGSRLSFPIATGKRVEDEVLVYEGLKNVKAENDTVYRCGVFTLYESENGDRKKVITFYVTDDLNHLPVRLDLFLNFGSAKAMLHSVYKYRHPLTSIVKD